MASSHWSAGNGDTRTVRLLSDLRIRFSDFA